MVYEIFAGAVYELLNTFNADDNVEIYRLRIRDRDYEQLNFNQWCQTIIDYTITSYISFSYFHQIFVTQIRKNLF